MVKPLRERYWLYRIRAHKDAKVFSELYHEHVARIHRFVLFKVGNEDDAREIVDDTFLKLWNHAVSGKPVTNLVGLLYTIARAGCADHLRKRRFETVPLDAIAEPADGLAASRLAANEELGETLRAMERLKEEYREVLFMRHVDGLSTGEIAATIGKSNGTVRVLLYRAKNALKDLLTK